MSEAPVLVVCPGGLDAAGGIGRHVRYTADAWRRLRLEPPLVVLDSYGRTRRLMPLAFARCAARIAWRAATGRARLVHLHMAADGSALRKLLLARLATLFGLRVVLHVHGSRFADFLAELPAGRLSALRAAMRRVEAVIVLGSGMRASLVTSLGLDPARVTVLPNAVPDDFFRLGRRRQADGRGTCRIVFLGRLGPRKGVPELLDALASLDRPDLDWEATLAGDGDIEASRARVAALDLGERVALTGWLDEGCARDLLREADLLVLPSRHEGQPMAILEAMAASLAVVATPVGAVAELIRDGENGCLVPPGDSDALASTLRRLIESPTQRRRLGDAARATAEEGHRIDEFCLSLQALYDASGGLREAGERPVLAAGGVA